MDPWIWIRTFTANLCDLTTPDCKVTIQAVVDPPPGTEVCECDGTNNIAATDRVDIPDIEVTADRWLWTAWTTTSTAWWVVYADQRRLRSDPPDR